jgi:hypothetical protein
VSCMKSRGHQGCTGQNMTRITVENEEDKEAVRPVGAWGYIGRATSRSRGSI